MANEQVGNKESGRDIDVRGGPGVSLHPIVPKIVRNMKYRTLIDEADFQENAWVVDAPELD